MNDIAKRAHELIAELNKKGFKGFGVYDVEASCEEDWTEHYACVNGLYVDSLDEQEAAGDYFDASQLEYDFEIMLRDWFTFPDEKTIQVRSHESKRDREFDSSNGLIMVRYRDGCHELEVYRLVDGKIPGGDEDA